METMEKMAQLFNPCGIFVSNGEVFIADTHNHRVRKVLRNGQIVTIAGNGTEGTNGDGQLATNAQLYYPTSVVVSSLDQVYIVCGNCIRKIDSHGIISTICGTGEKGFGGDGQLAVHAQLGYPEGLFVTDDEEVLIADSGNHCVRKIDRNGIISTIAGTGGKGGFNGDGQLATSASLNNPTSVFQYEHEIYIADQYNQRIRKIDHNGMISTIAGTGKMVRNGDDPTDIGWPLSLFIHNDHVYFSDQAHRRIRKFLPNNGIVTTIAGTNKEAVGFNDMLATETKLEAPRGIFIDNDLQIYIADISGNCVWKIDQNGMMRRIVGTGDFGYSGDVPFDFKQYPHIGPRKKPLIKPFPHAYHDLIVICMEMCSI